MTYTKTYNSDFNLDLHKNQDKVCFAIIPPRFTKSVSNVSSDNSRPSRRETENLCGVDFCIIPTSNVGEGQFLWIN